MYYQHQHLPLQRLRHSSIPCHKIWLFFAKKNLDEAIERNMWDGSLTKLSFAAIEKRLSDRFIDDRTLRQDSHSPTTKY